MKQQPAIVHGTGSCAQQRLLIADLLTITEQADVQQPDQRIEQIDDLYHDLQQHHQTVPPIDMRAFVMQHRAERLPGGGCDVLGHVNTGMQHPGRQR
jgi:hypothetical protein